MSSPTISTDTFLGPRPVVQFKPHSVDTLRGVTTESRFFPVRPDEGILLHSHISGSPFQSGSQSAESFSIHVYQQPMCQVSATRLALDIPASLAKAILRWRVAAITWMFGWTAVILGLQLEELARTGECQFGMLLTKRQYSVVWESPQKWGLSRVEGRCCLACNSVLPESGSCAGVHHWRFSSRIHRHPPRTVHSGHGFLDAWSYGHGSRCCRWRCGIACEACWQVIYKYNQGQVGNASFTANSSRPELTKAALPRLTLGLILLLSVAVIIPSGMALAILLLVFFALTSSSRGNDDVGISI